MTFTNSQFSILNSQFLLLLLLLLVPSMPALCDEVDNEHSVLVEGTELEQLQSVWEVLQLLPGVSASEEGITIAGRGSVDVFVGGRKISDLSELKHIAAYRVKKVEVLRHPGADYDKDAESVIVITLKAIEAEGFSLNNLLRLDFTPDCSLNEELSLSWRRKRLSLGAFVGWNEESRTFPRKIFLNRYQNHQTILESRSDVNPRIERNRFSARLSATYDLNASSKWVFNYGFLDKCLDRMDVPERSQLIDQACRHHDFALEYVGKVGDWKINIGNNSFVEEADMAVHYPTYTTYYLRNEYDIRTFARVSRPLWKGVMTLGVEHELDHMEVQLYEENPAYFAVQRIYLSTHAIHPDNILGVFASTTQYLGPWTVEAGLRYEYLHSVYRPCDDDGLMHFVDDLGLIVDYTIPDDMGLLSLLAKDRQIFSLRNDFYPSLKASRKIGKSELMLAHTENCVRPYLGITRLRFSELELLNEKILWAEKSSATSIEWNRNWIGLGVSHRFFRDPICKTLSTTNQYNAPDYQCLDFDLVLAPRVGFWSPMLHARLHKQWFVMPLASGKDRLLKPLATLTFNNTFTLPHGWLLRLNAFLRSCGAERNYYYFKPDFRVDASIQKTLWHERFTLSINAVNIFRSSYNDLGCYVQDYYDISQGIRDKNVSMISFAIRYKM